MKTRYQLLAIGICSILLWACSEDKGNYNYHPLPDIEITGVDSTLSVLTYETLKLTPNLGANAMADDQYSYEWKAINQNEEQEVTVIGDTKDLSYQVKLNPGIYTLYFTATEKNTGLFHQASYKLTVSDTMSEGWMVLCSDNGRARLDMFSDITKQLYTDILKDKGTPTLNGPRRIQWLSTMTDSNSPYYLLTDEGATRLGKDGFEWKPEYDFSYEMATTDKVTPYSIVTAGFGKMFVSGTKAYYCEIMGIDGLYGSAVNKDFEVAPYIGANSKADIYAALYLLYDITHKRFMAYCPLLAYNDLGGLNPLQGMTDMENIAINMKGNDMVVGNAFTSYPEGYDMVYMENTNYDPGNRTMGITYSILAEGNHRYLYGIQMGDMLKFNGNSYAIGKAYYGDLSGCTDITLTDNRYAFSSLRNCMYYSVGGTLYRVDLNSSPLRAEKQFTLSGETITCLKFNIYQEDDNATRSYNLVVGSEDAKGNGTLRVYDGLKNEGSFVSAQPIETHTGFAHIVDATYRERTTN